MTTSTAERYIWLGLHLGRHVEGIVDSYSGPAVPIGDAGGRLSPQQTPAGPPR
jgi:hypothetical protein